MPEDNSPVVQTEYRVKPHVRYGITRHEKNEDGSSWTMHVGSVYADGDTAFEVGYALAKQEADRLGCVPGDTRVIFPQTPVTYRLEPHPVYGVEHLAFEGRSPNPHE